MFDEQKYKSLMGGGAYFFTWPASSHHLLHDRHFR